MTESISRREALTRLGALGAGLTLVPRGILRGSAPGIIVAGRQVEIAVASLSATTVRVTLRPLTDGSPDAVPSTGALAGEQSGTAVERSRTVARASRMRAGNVVVS